jgi:peptidyl-prolyl cis-trans isomerase D
MLSLMRQKAGSWVIKAILFAIVVVFVFWGVGSFDDRGGGNVATVNGETISFDEFNQSYNMLLDQYMRTFGNNLTDEMLKALNIKRQALDRIIDQRLLMEEARRLGLRISDEELVAAIQAIPAFQNNGAFDPVRYEALLASNRLTPEMFEMNHRETMLIEKLQNILSSSVKVADPEAKEWYDWNEAEVDIRYVHFDPSTYTEISTSDEALAEFYEEHKEQYKTEKKRKAHFVRFAPAAFMDKVAVSDEEVREYFDANPEQFKQEKTVEARHILIKADQNAAEEVVEAAQKRAREAYNKAKEGADFAELAKTYSEGPTKDRGGFLGAFRKDAMVTPFAEKAFAMAAGEISEPVRTQFGWHVIKVEKINPASIKTFEEAAPDIRAKLRLEQSKSAAYDEAETLFDAAFEGDDLLQIAKSQQRQAETTPLFAEKNPPSNIPNAKAFATEVFALSLMEISEVKEIGDEFFLIQVAEEVLPEVKPMDAVKEQVRVDLEVQLREERAQKEAEAFLEKLKDDAALETIAAEEGLTVNSTGYFKRNKGVGEMALEQEVNQAAFKLSSERRVADQVLKGRNGYYVIELKDRKLPEEGGFADQKEQIVNMLLQQKQQKTMQALVKQLRDDSDISISQGFLDS